MRELDFPVVALYFAAVTAAFLLAGIADLRFYDAYFSRYFPEDSRGFWRYLGRYQRERLRWLQPVDDPLVERRRRQLLLAWVPIVVLILIPLAIALYQQWFTSP
jgi:hypothetical protein